MDMDYSLIIEKAKYLFSMVFLIGLFVGYFGREFESFCSFLYKLFRKYRRLRRIKRRSLNGRK